jgi:hypothetical protein
MRGGFDMTTGVGINGIGVRTGRRDRGHDGSNASGIRPMLRPCQRGLHEIFLGCTALVALAGPIPVLGAALLALTVLTVPVAPAAAQDATWLTSPGSGDFDTGSNWSTGTVPTGTVSFGASGTASLSFSSNTTIGGWTFNSWAAAYTVSNSDPHTLNFTDAGVIVDGGSVAITNDIQGVVQFLDSSTAGNATITNYASGTVDFSGSTGPAGDHRLAAGSIAGAGRQDAQRHGHHQRFERVNRQFGNTDRDPCDRERRTHRQLGGRHDQCRHQQHRGHHGQRRSNPGQRDVVS